MDTGNPASQSSRIFVVALMLRVKAVRQYGVQVEDSYEILRLPETLILRLGLQSRSQKVLCIPNPPDASGERPGSPSSITPVHSRRSAKSQPQTKSAKYRPISKMAQNKSTKVDVLIIGAGPSGSLICPSHPWHQATKVPVWKYAKCLVGLCFQRGWHD